MSVRIGSRRKIVAGAAGAALMLVTGCAAKVNDAGSNPAASGPAAAGSTVNSAEAACTAPVKMAINAWVGYEANAAVTAYVLQTKLGCKVTKIDLKEEIAWQGFPNGAVDIIIENWGHPDLVKRYIDTDKTAVDAGPTGNIGQIGWYVTPATAKMYPDITDYKNLNKYADKFATSESGGKGQLLDGDPSFVTNDANLVTNLKLNYKVIYAGSEAALITSFRTAEKQKTPLLGYFYSPQWFFAEVPLVKVKLPPYTPGCDAVPEKVACDYADLKLNKIISTKFANSGSPAVSVIKKFSWNNDDQNLVAKYITVDKMTADQAAKKWVDANPDKVKAWLS